MNKTKHTEKNITEYKTFRSKLCDGQVIAISSHTGFGKLIKIGQKRAKKELYSHFAEYTHVAFLKWSAGRLYCVEMNGGGNCLRPLSQYINEGCSFIVYDLHVDQERFRRSFLKWSNHFIPYGLGDIAKLAIQLLFCIKVKHDSYKNLVCSQYVRLWLESLGFNDWEVEFKGAIAMPAEICAALQKYEVFKIEAK